MIGENAFWQFDENRAKTGYKSAWLVKHPDDTSNKYSLIGLTTSVPYPFGEMGTEEIDVLQSSSVGLLETKFSMEKVDVPVYHHRDNAYRYNKLQGMQLQFMSINSELMGYTFTGTIKYRPDTAESGANTATVTITPIAGSETPIYDVRDLVIETIALKPIPEQTNVGKAIDFSANNKPTISPGSLSFTVNKIAHTTNAETLAVATTDYTVDTTSGATITFNTTGLMAVTVSATGYASWTTTIYVNAAETSTAL